jgi:hypothetical protein
MHKPEIRSLVTVDEYIAERGFVFPSRESWRWFERRHRAALIESGALTAPTGRKLLDPALADAFVSRVGEQRMRNTGGTAADAA